MIDQTTLKDVERVTRFLMAAILLTAGTSKFFSHGGFVTYYAHLFSQPDLRIQLPMTLVGFYLHLIKYIEIGIGLALLCTPCKRVALYAWFAFMLSLLVGHYVMQQWSPTRQMLNYFFMGLLCMALPHHRSWFRRDRD